MANSKKQRSSGGSASRSQHAPSTQRQSSTVAPHDSTLPGQTTTTTTTTTTSTVKLRKSQAQHSHAAAPPPVPRQHLWYAPYSGLWMQGIGLLSRPLYPQPPSQQGAIDYSSLRTPSATQQVQNNKCVTTTQQQHQQQTLNYKGSNAGGTARQAAAAQGPLQLAQFDQRVQLLIASLDACPDRYSWYPTKRGYLCAGGSHYILHKEIDAWARNALHRPRILCVNHPFAQQLGYEYQSVHPPQVDAWARMHRAHADFVELAVQAGMVGEKPPCKCFAECASGQGAWAPGGLSSGPFAGLPMGGGFGGIRPGSGGYGM